MCIHHQPGGSSAPGVPLFHTASELQIHRDTIQLHLLIFNIYVIWFFVVMEDPTTTCLSVFSYIDFFPLKMQYEWEFCMFEKQILLALFPQGILK